MDAAELTELLKQPEGEQLEFKSGDVRPELVARVLGAFANTKGGTLVWGFDERHQKAVGVKDAELTEQVVRDGLALLSPQPDTSIETVELEGVPLVVAKVSRVPGYLYLANRELLERHGASVRPMSPDRLAEMTGAKHSSRAIDASEDAAIENSQVLAKAVEALHDDISVLKKQNSFVRRAAIALGGATFGALLRPVIDLMA